MQQRVFTYNINMSGRMYDPLLSSFLSPDNYMQDPTSLQEYISLKLQITKGGCARRRW